MKSPHSVMLFVTQYRPNRVVTFIAESMPLFEFSFFEFSWVKVTNFVMESKEIDELKD